MNMNINLKYSQKFLQISENYRLWGIIFMKLRPKNTK